MNKGSILIVDDEEVILKTLNTLLVKEGYQVSVAPNAESGLELFQKGKYPLVITDLIMDGIGGVELVRLVKSMRPETQVLVITGCGALTTTNNAMEQGADDYLLKPCQRSELLEKVANCFKHYEQRHP